MAVSMRQHLRSETICLSIHINLVLSSCYASLMKRMIVFMRMLFGACGRGLFLIRHGRSGADSTAFGVRHTSLSSADECTQAALSAGSYG